MDYIKEFIVTVLIGAFIVNIVDMILPFFKIKALYKFSYKFYIRIYRYYSYNKLFFKWKYVRRYYIKTYD